MKKFCYLLLLVICSCSAKTLNLSSADNNKTFIISKGQEVVLTLPSNPSTGYNWSITTSANKANSFKLLENKFYAKSTSANMVGAGGTQIYKFKALKSDNFTITAQYFRSWLGFNQNQDTQLTFFIKVE